MKYLALVTIFAILVVNLSEAESLTLQGPVPKCENSGVCKFKGIATDQVNLAKCNDICTCEPAKDEESQSLPTWKLQWGSDGCKIASTGPCGESSDGLKIECQSGNECLEGRCRDPKHLREGSKHTFCYDNIDCKQGLVCKSINLYGDPWNACVPPSTPEFLG